MCAPARPRSRDCAQPARARAPTAKELEHIAVFERTRPFFTSRDLFAFAWTGYPPTLPKGRTEAERRGRLFFEDVPFTSPTQKAGICAACHSGPMLNETNEFLPAPPMRRGGRFQSVLVSELNAAGKPIKGLYAVGNDAASVMGGNYPGAGITLGPALTFGYVAAMQLVKAEALTEVTMQVEQRETVAGGRRA
jgi:hypothetical protein